MFSAMMSEADLEVLRLISHKFWPNILVALNFSFASIHHYTDRRASINSKTETPKSKCKIGYCKIDQLFSSLV